MFVFEHSSGSHRILSLAADLVRTGLGYRGFVAGDFGVVVDRGNAPFELVGGFLIGLAHFAGHHLRHQRRHFGDVARHLVHHLGALQRIDGIPDLLGLVGDGNGLVDIGLRAIGHFGDTVFGRRVDNIEVLGSGAAACRAVDENRTAQPGKLG